MITPAPRGLKCRDTCCQAADWPGLPGSSPAGRCPMTTAVPSTTLATIQPAFTDPERLALAGFLAGYRGLTREAYALDLRQFTVWCRACSLALFAVRRADVEGFARELEARGRARATVTRRLCTIAGFFKVRRRRRTPRAFPGRPRPAAARGLRVARRRPGPQRAGRHAGGRRARPAGRPCADLATRAERPAGIGGHRRGHRAPGPGARAPDADHHPVLIRAARSSPSRSHPAPPGRSTWPPRPSSWMTLRDRAWSAHSAQVSAA